jgi:hypothetical protein
MPHHTRFFIVPAMALTLVGAGCNPFARVQEKVAQNVVENVIENQVKKESGKDVNVDLENGGMTVTDAEGNKSFTMGENVKIPSDFPSDIPIYTPSTPKSVMQSAEEGSVFLMLQTDAPSDVVQEWYKTEAAKKGWKKTASLEMGEGNYVLSFEQNGAKFSVTIATSEDGKTAITLTRSKN